MKVLEERIINDGYWVGEGILKVDSFLNHQLDIALMDQIGEEIAGIYDGERIDKILTAEASGIAVACSVSRAMNNKPVVFAKKKKPSTMVDGFYSVPVRSFTKNTESNYYLSKRFLNAGERVLIVDDFLAKGEAGLALCNLAKEAGAVVAGLSAVIEKKEQGGADKIKAAHGIDVRSVAVITNTDGNTIQFE